MLKRNQTNNTSSNSATLIRGGSAYFQLLKKLIDAAEEVIHLQFYIFSEDETGITISEALKAAAKREVKVYLLLDAYGSQGLSKAFVQEWVDAGIHFRWFQPLLKSRKFYLGRRLHHKIVVVDSCYSLVSGLNIDNKYNDTPDAKAWLDWALYCEGAISLQLEDVCRTKMRIRIPKGKSKHQAKTGNCVIGVRVNDWVGRRSEITRAYLKMLQEATSHVTIMSPYFLPGYQFRKRMNQAARRGVKVRVILAGDSDVPVAKYAERWMYDWLLRNKIEIFEYQKNVLHGKIATADSKWATVGSYNVNNLSAYASIELNLEVIDHALVQTIEQQLNSIIERDCKKVTQHVYKKQINIVKRFAQGAAYNMLRFMLFIFTLRIRHPE